MLPEERLNDLAAREIAALEAEGIRLTAAEVVKLNALGWAIETPCARRELSRGVPVMLCEGVYLWPLTIQAADWFDRVGERLRPSKMDAIRHPRLSADLPMLALAYAMANCYAEGNPLDAEGPEASRAVLAWASKLKCTCETFRDGIQSVIAQQDAPTINEESETPSIKPGEFSVYLAARAGGTPEYWERACSVGYAVAVFMAILKQAAADGAPLPNDPKLLATRAFGIEVERIRESRKDATNV